VKTSGKYYLLLEKYRDGIWASNLEAYILWLLEKFSGYESDKLDVNIEPAPSKEFIKRLDALETISEVTIRVVRPNPGWDDLDTALGRESDESGSSKTDVTMKSKRSESLNKKRGIIAAVKDRFSKGILGYAKIKGKKQDKKEDVFSTEKLCRSDKHSILTDDKGLIVEETAMSLLNRLADDLVKESQNKKN
jgi:hypothetical protein